MSFTKFCKTVGLASAILTQNAAACWVSETQILETITYPGEEAERSLVDLVLADYHCGKAHYYAHHKEGGFMAAERFDLTRDRAIGDIRETAHLQNAALRQEKTLQIARNWKSGFARAPLKNRPEP